MGEDGTDQYVGRTDNLGQRMGNHLSADPTQASLAVKIARKALGLKPTYKRGGRFKDLMQRDPDVLEAFSAARVRVKSMAVRFVFESDPVRQALLEIYASVSLGTPLNNWKTA